MRKGQLSPVRIAVLAMLVLSVVVIILLILRPSLVGYADASNESRFQAFKGINELISGAGETDETGTGVTEEACTDAGGSCVVDCGFGTVVSSVQCPDTADGRPRVCCK